LEEESAGQSEGNREDDVGRLFRGMIDHPEQEKDDADHRRYNHQQRSLGVKLIFPIFFCVLPTLFVVTIGPVIMRLVRDLIPMIENM
jgi:hypothetical protein